MRTMSVAGIGAGHPEHITVQALSTCSGWRPAPRQAMPDRDVC